MFDVVCTEQDQKPTMNPVNSTAASSGTTRGRRGCYRGEASGTEYAELRLRVVLV